MASRIFLLALLTWGLALHGQMYFPPKSGTQWDTANTRQLGWCTEKWDTLEQYLALKNTKSFIVLHRGKIARETYYGNFNQDSLWYWASAGKTLLTYLIGRAQAEGYLNINNRSSDYLGTGWTSMPLAKENLIRVKDQLQMTTGLEYQVADLNCTQDTCLQYRADAGNQWFYHNAPYLLLHDVLESAVGQSTNFSQFRSFIKK